MSNFYPLRVQFYLTTSGGYEGVVHGFAANMNLVEHYVKTFNAEHLGMLHPYQIVIGAEDAKKILEVYKYEWN